MADLVLSYELIMIGVYCVACAFLTVWVLYYFTKKNPLHPVLYIILGLTYYVNFVSIALVSIDISTSKLLDSEDDKTTIENRKYYLLIIWRVIYWSIQVLAWIFVPIAQSYVESGYFNVFRKFIDAIYDNIKLYAIIIVIGAVGGGAIAIYMFVTGQFTIQDITWKGLAGLAQSASNAFGLSMLISFLGYGIGITPKNLWYTGSFSRNTKYFQFKVYAIHEECEEFRGELEKTLQDCLKLKQTIPESHALRYYADLVIRRAEKEIERLDIRVLTPKLGEEEKTPTYSQIVSLNKALLRSTRSYHKLEYELEYYYKQAFFTEDINRTATLPNATQIESPFRAKKKNKSCCYRFQHNPLFARIEYIYYVHVRRHLFRVLTILFVLWSLVIMYSELIFPVQAFLTNELQLDPSRIPILSAFYWCVYGIGKSKQAILLQIFSFCTLSLISVTVYYGMFKARIKAFDLYNLVPHHSDDASLLFSAVFLCRVVPTLCYNYLQISGVTANDGVSFFTVMGVFKTKELWIFGVIGRIIADYSPFLLVFIVFLSITNLPCWLCQLCGIGNYFVYNEKMGAEAIDGGSKLVELQRKIKLRELDDGALEDEDDEDGDNLHSHRRTSHRGDDDELEEQPTSKPRQKKTTDDILKEMYAKRGKVRGGKQTTNSDDDEP